MAPDPAAEIRDGVRKLYEASPLGRIGSTLNTIGEKTVEVAGKAKRVVEDTAQGTKRLLAPKAKPAPRGDISLPPSRPAATPQGSVRGTAPKAAPPKRLKKVSVSPTDNGGFVVSHHYHPANGRGTPKAERHAFTSYDDVHAHLEKMGTPSEDA